MFRYVLLCLVALISSDSSDGQTSLESMNTEKKEKRRAQNVQAAKKSYEAKKKERSDLQTKNTELYETQMKLLHDKSRLEEKTTLLQRIIDAMNHQCLESPARNTFHPTDTRSERRAALSSNCRSLNGCHSDVKLEPLNDDNMALDLSARAHRHQSHSTNESQVRDSYFSGARAHTKDNVQIKMDDQHSDDGHIVDLSTLELGATQEVGQASILKKTAKHNRDSNSNDVGVFIPETKPKKSRRNPPVSASRPARACATDAMKKQRGAGLCPRDNRASSF